MNAIILFLAGVLISVSQINTDRAPTEKFCLICFIFLVIWFIFEDLFYISNVCVMGFKKPTQDCRAFVLSACGTFGKKSAQY